MNKFSLYNTGVDNDGKVLANSEIDSHWMVQYTDSTKGVGPKAFVQSVADWIGDDIASAWISISNDLGIVMDSPSTRVITDYLGSDLLVDYYVYTQEFSVPRAPSVPPRFPVSVTISGRCAADNYILGYAIDSLPSLPLPNTKMLPNNEFADFHSFLISGLVFPGIHKIMFAVQNSLGLKNQNPTGLRVEFDPILDPSILNVPRGLPDRIFVGVVAGNSGVVLRAGIGTPLPVPGSGDPVVRNVLAGLAIGQLASQLSQTATAKQIEGMAVEFVSGQLKTLGKSKKKTK
jgi:hypothetical protein